MPQKPFLVFSLSLDLFSFPAGSDLQNVFLAPATASAVALPAIRARPLSVPRTAPYDSCGHSQETSAPNLQSGPLPAPVRFRARAVSNSFGQLLSVVLVAKFFRAAGPSPQFAGSQACLECHANIHSEEVLTPHADAFQTLVNVGQQRNPSCCRESGRRPPGFREASGY